MNRVASLDLLRTFAIVFVLLLHSLEFLTNVPASIVALFSYGWIGVDLFFLLSGFLIGSQAFNTNDNEDSPIKKFLIKRIFRTIPLYYTILLIYILLKPFVGYPFTDTKLKYFFFLQNFTSPKDFVQSWSLCIEEQFYLVFPLFFYKFNLKKIPSIYWLLPGLLSLITRLIFYQAGILSDSPPAAAYNYQFNFFTHLDGISWGIFLASTFKTWSQFKNKELFIIPGLAGLLITMIYMGPLNLNATIISGYQMLALSFSCLLIGLYDFKNFPAEALIQKIATWSYGIYLWNNLVAKVIEKFFYQQNNYLKTSVFIMGTVGLSAITYFMIEQPMLNFRNRLLVKIK